MLAPDGCTVADSYQLRADAEPLSGFLHRAGGYIIGGECLSRLTRIWLLFFVAQNGAGGPQSQVAIPWGYGQACWQEVR